MAERQCLCGHTQKEKCAVSKILAINSAWDIPIRGHGTEKQNNDIQFEMKSAQRLTNKELPSTALCL